MSADRVGGFFNRLGQLQAVTRSTDRGAIVQLRLNGDDVGHQGSLLFWLTGGLPRYAPGRESPRCKFADWPTRKTPLSSVHWRDENVAREMISPTSTVLEARSSGHHQLVKRIGQREAHLFHLPLQAVQVVQVRQQGVMDATGVLSAD